MLNKLRVPALFALFALFASPQNAQAQAVQTPPGEVCFQATTGINGYIGLLGTITGGSGGANGTYGGVALTGGSGTGATANITVGGGHVTKVSILNPGTQYVSSDVLSAASGTIGGVSGFTVPVSSTTINSSLAGGAAGMYVPSTLTFKQTWKDAGEITLNTNPVGLDANGCARIYGTGTYRQILKDSLGNTVWDQPTTVPAVSVVAGPNSTTSGDVATWSNSTGTLLADTPGANVSVTTPGSSAARTIGARFGQEFNVLDYGAKCDGITNDGVSIQTAETAAQNASGGIVRIPVSTSGCVDTGTLTVTGNGVSIEGYNDGASALKFSNGAVDDIDIGGQVAATQYVNVKNLTISHGGVKSGGIALSSINTYRVQYTNVLISGACNGLYFQQTNDEVVTDSVITVNACGVGSYGVKWDTASPARSDVLTFKNTTIQASATGADCFIWDGNTDTLRTFGLGMLSCRYGLRIQNTRNSASFYPQFGFFTDLEIDGGTSEAVRIEGGNYFRFVNSDLDACNDVTTTDYVVDVLPDSAHSVTRAVDFVGDAIHCAPNGIMSLNARNSKVVGSSLFGGGGSAATAPVLDIGASAQHIVVQGNALGLVFGSNFNLTTSLQIENGAQAVVYGGNDMAVSGTSTVVVNNAAGVNAVSSGANWTGNSSDFGGVGTDVRGAGAINTYYHNNNFSTAGTQTTETLATGTASSFLSLSQADGATPSSTISSGSGSTGGLTIGAGAGNIRMNVTGGSIGLNPSTQVQFVNAGSFAVVANCGGAATKCLVVLDNAGATRYIPVY